MRSRGENHVSWPLAALLIQNVIQKAGAMAGATCALVLRAHVLLAGEVTCAMEHFFDGANAI